MDTNDRKAIEDLFGKLAEVEAKGQPRDAEAEAFIRERISAHPASAYYMAQTIVVQEQALAAAQHRIAELETQMAQAPARDSGLFGGLFGNDRPASSPVPSIRPAAGAQAGAPQAGSGGFLAGAAQTAMGVAGGVLLANMIGGLFRDDEAKAASADQPQDQQPDQEQAALEPASDDGSFDFGDFGGGFDI